MRRRRFITLATGAPVLWSLSVRAQQPGKLPIIGILVPGTRSTHGAWIAAFVQRLNDLGWIDGRTVAIEYRWAEGSNERTAEIATEFVRLNVDVIATSATGPTLAAKKATSSIPIVFAAAGDPVGAGLVASLARPGGNVTGLSLQFTDLAGKRLGLLRDILPSLRRVGILADAGNPAALLELGQVQAAATTLALEAVTPDLYRPEDIAPAMGELRGRIEALYVIADPLTVTNQVRINALALAAGMPTMLGTRELVRTGGLMSYGANFFYLFRRAAELVDRILRGARPADIPIEQPTQFELVISLRTAKALGLAIPQSLLVQADEVFE